MRVVRTSSRFSHFANDRVDSLREWVVENGERSFSAHQIGVRSEVEDVHDELRYRIPSDPEEDVLSILDQEETVSFESFRRERERMRKDYAGIRNRAALAVRGISTFSNHCKNATRTHFFRHVVE
jgi:ribosomal protein S13